MSEAKEPTARQWKRRALHAEEQVAFLQSIRALEANNGTRNFRELSAARVALREAQEAINWALEQQT